MKDDSVEDRIDIIHDATVSIHDITHKEDYVISDDFSPVIKNIQVVLDEEDIIPEQKILLEKFLRQLTSS
jgi:hypothetical protein